MPRSRKTSKISVKSLAEAAGISEQAIYKNTHVVRTEDGDIDVSATMNLAKIREETEREQFRSARAKAKISEMEADQKAGSLISVELAAEEQSRGDQIVAQELLAIPDRIAPRLQDLPAREIRVLLMREIRQALGIAAEKVIAA